jgi:GWxTD domain-containing protein
VIFRKAAIILALILSIQALMAEQLGMFVEVKRYLNANKDTKFVIDYQVPYKNLMFRTRENAYFAELKVNIEIAYPDSENYIPVREFTNNIGVTRKYDVTDSQKSFLDRISLTPPQTGFKLKVNFEDINGQKSYQWSYVTENLKPDEIVSDLELIQTIRPDTTLYSQKYVREKKSFLPSVSGIINNNYEDSIYIFCEYYASREQDAKATLTVYKDSTAVFISNIQREEIPYNGNLLFPINISNLEPGRYVVKVEARNRGAVQSKTLVFFITEQAETRYFIFSDVEEEHQFIRRLAPSRAANNWDSMSQQAKKRFISNFWQTLASANNMSVEDVLELYTKRIDHANRYYSHFDKGWNTDMGRVYIRNGPPDEIEKDTSSDETRFVRKDYQIWKYLKRSHPVYIFVDIAMNGNFKLVYAENDEQESTDPDWKRYLGTDFDESKLDN